MIKEIFSHLGDQIAKNHFLSEKNIASLINEGRVPFRMGFTISGKNQEWNAQYVIPPKNYRADDIKDEGVDCGGAYRYYYNDGTNKVAESVELNSEQAQKLEELLKRLTNTAD